MRGFQRQKTKNELYGFLPLVVVKRFGSLRLSALCGKGEMPLRRESLKLSEDAIFPGTDADSSTNNNSSSAPKDANMIGEDDMAGLSLPGTVFEQVRPLEACRRKGGLRFVFVSA